jgi:hypothetical protein
MKKAPSNKVDELRPEYDLSKLKGGVRGKYYKRARAGTNLVLIEPDLANVFPDTDSVNRALRLLADTAEAATGPKRRARRAPNKRLKRTTGKPAA